MGSVRPPSIRYTFRDKFIILSARVYKMNTCKQKQSIRTWTICWGNKKIKYFNWDGYV